MCQTSMHTNNELIESEKFREKEFINMLQKAKKGAKILTYNN